MTRRGRGRPPHPDILTPAEWRVLEELRTGATYAEIAVRLGVSPDAIRFHVRNMRAKLNLHDRAELVAWRPPDGERRRLFRALFAPLAGLPVAARTIAGVAAAAAVAGGIVATLILVVALGRGSGQPPTAAAPDAGTVTSTPARTPEATATPIPAPSSGTPPTRPSPPPTAVEGADCQYDQLAVARVTEALDRRPLMAEDPPPTHLVDQLRAQARYGRHTADPWPSDPAALVAIGSVRGVKVLGQEAPLSEDDGGSDGVLFVREAYMGFEVEVREVIHGEYVAGSKLWIVSTFYELFEHGDEQPGVRLERYLSVARDSLLCSDVFFAIFGDEFDSSKFGEDVSLSERYYEGSAFGYVFAQRGKDDLLLHVKNYRNSQESVQYRDCSLFSGLRPNPDEPIPYYGTFHDIASNARVVEDIISFSDAIIFGDIVEVISRGTVLVQVDHVVYGELKTGSQIRVSMPLFRVGAAASSGEGLPCSGGLFVLSGSGSVYGLVDSGLYLASDAGHITNPFRQAEWSFWGAYYPIGLYGVGIEDKTLEEFAVALQHGIGTTCVSRAPQATLLYPLSWWASAFPRVWEQPNLLEDSDLVIVGTMVAGEALWSHYLVDVEVQEVLHSRQGIAPDAVKVLFGWNGPAWYERAGGSLPGEDILLVLRRLDLTEEQWPGPVPDGPVYALFEYGHSFLPEGLVARRADDGFQTIWVNGLSPRSVMEAWGLDTCTSFDELALAVGAAFAAVE